MKELEKLNQDYKEVHAQKQFEKKTVFLGSERLRPGHRCFEINNQTLDCKEASYKKEVHFDRHTAIGIDVKENHTYVNALNAKNAIKVFKRLINSI